MICLDTTVLVDLLRSKSSPRRKNAEDRIRGFAESRQFLYTTRVNIAEILVGAFRGADPEVEKARIKLILQFVTILELDEMSADRFARIKAAAFNAGRPVGDADLLIAAIALSNGCSIMTRNLRDFQAITGLIVDGY